MANLRDVIISGDLQDLTVDGRFKNYWTIQLQLLQQIVDTLNEIKEKQILIQGVMEEIRDQP